MIPEAIIPRLQYWPVEITKRELLEILQNMPDDNSAHILLSEDSYDIPTGRQYLLDIAISVLDTKGKKNA